MSQQKQKNLVIVESPAKAKTIKGFLGPDFTVEASYGHVRDLPEGAKEIPAEYKSAPWARLGVNVEKNFEPIYVVPDSKKKHVAKLKQAMKGADSLYLATDEDREGESISWHVLKLLKPPKTVPVHRIVFHEVTPDAIREAVAHPRQIDEQLVSAQEARRVLDRLFGYSLSPVLWKKVAPGLSAGRVQSVAVRLIVLRERERIAFVQSEYWDLEATLESHGQKFKARLAAVDGKRIADGKSFDPHSGALQDKNRLLLLGPEAEPLAEAAANSRPWIVQSVESRADSQKPYAPFTTSTLQQEANRKLRMSAKRTMQIAQKLYEGVDLDGQRVGLITYMRTDSTTLSERALTEIRSQIKNEYGTEYLPPKPIRYKTKTKNAQEAHEAIRPTDASRKPSDIKAKLDEDEFKLYELIWKRSIASQMLPAQFERTTAAIQVNADGRSLEFTAAGKRIAFPGFLRAYVEGSDDPEAELGDKENLLPKLAEGDAVEPVEVESQQHSTRPPARYTEASLVKKLEEEGVGRPSTYASIIATIQDRGYVRKSGAELIPTFTAFCVTLLLEKSFDDLVDTAFTARMEDALDDIAAGKIGSKEILKTFYFGGKDTPGLKNRAEKLDMEYPALPIGTDPASSQPIVVKVGKYGAYLQRDGEKANIPQDVAPQDLNLDRALQILSAQSDEPETIAHDPATGRGIFLRTGRFGTYLELEPTGEQAAAKQKPKRVSIPKDLSPSQITPEIAQALISLPRTVGLDPKTGEEITAAIGRFGPFVKRGSEFRSLASWREACEITLSEASALLDAPKTRAAKGAKGPTKPQVMRELSDDGQRLRVMNGKYGPYVTDGTTNAKIPNDLDPQTITVQQAQSLIERKKSA